VDLLTQDLFIRVTDSFNRYEALTCLRTFVYIQKTFYRDLNGRIHKTSRSYWTTSNVQIQCSCDWFEPNVVYWIKTSYFVRDLMFSQTETSGTLHLVY